MKNIEIKITTNPEYTHIKTTYLSRLIRKYPIVTVITSIIIICISFIPIYNRYLTHQRADRFDFNLKTMFLEYSLVFVLLFILFAAETLSTKTIYGNRIKHMSSILGLYLFASFIVNLFSLDVSRSLGLFAFGMVGPFILYLIIAYKTEPNSKNLQYIFKGFIISNILYLIIAYLFAFRFGFSGDLVEVREGNNIYGSNSVIGTICFLLPIAFVNGKYLFKLQNHQFLYILFGVLSIVWITISLSRWGYASLFLAYVSTTIAINKSLSYKKFLYAIILFTSISYFVPDISEQLLTRFTGQKEPSETELSLSDIYEHTMDEARFIRWENAFKTIKNNPFRGVGIGNNYMIDPYETPDAHNLLINILLEQGVFVFIILVSIIISLYKFVRTVLKYSKSDLKKRMIISLFLGIIIFHFWSLTGSSYIQAGGIISAVKNYYFFIAMGLIVYISKINEPHLYTLKDEPQK